jgi:hypothetical protein
MKKGGSKDYGYAQILNTLSSNPWSQEAKELDHRPPPVLGGQRAVIERRFLYLRGSQLHICDAFLNLKNAGADVEVLDRILVRLVYLENCQKSTNRRLRLEHARQCANRFEKAIQQAYGNSWQQLFAGTLLEIHRLRDQVTKDLEAWPKSNRGRGTGPQTPIIISLLKYIQKCTAGKFSYEDVATIIETAYMVAGSNRPCPSRNLEKLFQLNPELHNRWQWRIRDALREPVQLGQTRQRGRGTSTNKTKRQVYIH